MRRIVFTCLLFFMVVVSFGQKRQLNKIISKINEGEFVEANEKLNEIASKEGNLPEVAFVRYLFYSKRKQSSDDLDSAYLYFKMAYESLDQLEAKEKEKLCKDFDFCEASKASFFTTMEYELFRSYSENFSKDKISSFQKKYPENQFFTQSAHLVDSLDYVQIKNKTDKKLLYEYIKTHPESAFNETVRQQIYSIAFEEAKKDGSITALEFFIKNYEEAPQIKTADSLLMEATWSSIKNKGTIEDYKTFIRRFPNSVYNNQATEKAETIAWNHAEAINTSSSYKEFYTLYPNAKNAELAKKRYDELRDNVVPFFTKEKKYRLYDVDKKDFISDEIYDHLIITDESKFIVSKFRKYGLVNKMGETILPITYNCISPNNKFLNVKLGDKIACYNLEGDKIIDFKYDDYNLDNGFIKGVIKKSDTSRLSQYDFYDMNGKMLFSGIYESIYSINDTLFIASKANQTFLTNRSQKLISSKYSTIWRQDKDFFIVSSVNKYGLMDIYGKIIVPVSYSNISSCDSSSFFILRNANNQEALIDKKGNFLINFQPKVIVDLNEGMFKLVEEEKRYSEDEDAILYNARKKIFAVERFNWINTFNGGYSIAGKRGKAGFIDTDASWIISPIFSNEMKYEDELGHGDFEEDLFYEEDENEEENYVDCITNINGRSKLDFEYYYSGLSKSIFSDNLAPVKIDSLYGYVNKKGEIAIPIIYSYADVFYKGIANVSLYQNDKYVQQVIDEKGKIVLNNARINTYFNNNTKALLVRNLNEFTDGEQEYYIYDLSNKRIKKLNIGLGHTYLNPLSEYFISNYKDEFVIVFPDGTVMMDKDIDFSEYEFKHLVLKVNEKYYNGLYDDAITEYLKLLKQRPQSYPVNYMLSQCYLQKENDYYYNYYLSKAIDIRPDKIELKRTRMDWNYEKKNWREVINDAANLIASYTYIDENIYFKRAYANQQLGYDDDAMSDYTFIISRKKDALAYNNRGVIYNNRKQYSLALDDYNNAIKNCPSSDKQSLGLYYNNKGSVLYSLVRKTEACAAWRMADSLGYSEASGNIRNFCR